MRNKQKIKVTDFIAEYLRDLGVTHTFAITGGASVHMIKSIGDCDGIEYVCPHHEQAAAMAADAYSRVTGNIGCALATSGPGATNLLTGIACAWFDSVPVIYLTGQVTRFRFKGNTGVRQMGFQETDIVSMAKPITKYATLVERAEDLRTVLDKAVLIARSGRPGPVLIDIPDDLQREMVDPTVLNSGVRGAVSNKNTSQKPKIADVNKTIKLLQASKRPVMIIGQGVRLAGAVEDVKVLAKRLQIPVCPSWAAADIFTEDTGLLGGTFGTHGTRAGNFAVQNADFILSIGARLSTRETGSPMSSWAREAKLTIVDIDAAELKKFPHFGKLIHVPIEADAKAFISTFNKTLSEGDLPNTRSWLNQVASWRKTYKVCTAENYAEYETNPYVFVDQLSDQLETGDIIVTDTGCAVAWTMQGFKFKDGQRLFHAFNNTPMGYAIPAAIGAAFATGRKKRIICIVGDGSMMMNLQELATIQHHQLPIKIFLLNNGGYSMVRQTQEQWLDAQYDATSKMGGVSFPDFEMLAKASQLVSFTIGKNDDVKEAIHATISEERPSFCNVIISPEHRVLPQTKFGFPIEDAEPLLPRAEFLKNMLVKPLPVSINEK